MFAVGCFFVFCRTAGGSCGEAGKWCGAGNIRLICLEVGIIDRVGKEGIVIWRCKTDFPCKRIRAILRIERACVLSCIKRIDQSGMIWIAGKI